MCPEQALEAAAPDAAEQPPQPDWWACLPSDVALHVLRCAGGPAALQDTRSAAHSWRHALDSLVERAELTTVPADHSAGGSGGSSCARALAQLPRLATVDLSGCCQPLPQPVLPALLADLAGVSSLACLKLSTWCLAQQGCNTGSRAAACPQQQQQPAAAAPGAAAAAAGGRAPPLPRGYALALPREIGRLRQLRRLVIQPCPGVSRPAVQAAELSPAIMQLQQLTHLELHCFLPACHYLRGLSQLQHLSITAQLGGPADGGGALAADCAAAAAALAALQAAEGLTSLHVRFLKPEQQLGGHEPGAAAAAGAGAAAAGAAAGVQAAPDGWKLLEQLCALMHVRRCRERCGSSSSGSGSGTSQPLQELALVGAGLFHLPAGFVAACGALRLLDLSGSELDEASLAALGACGRLAQLRLGGNCLRGLPAACAGLTQLEVLVLSGNPLGAVPPVVAQLQQLRELLLASSGLALLPSFVSSLARLERLDVSSNKLQELPDELCACTRLRELDVSKNRLLALPVAFSCLSGITQLSLTGNHLEALPPGLEALAHLAHLGLGLNYYKAGPFAACFAALATSLRALQLQHAATVLDDAPGLLAAVGRLTGLTSLCAGSNQLREIPEEWRQLKQLKVLQLAHNAFEALPITLLALTSLTFLDLSYNRILQLPFWVGSPRLQRLQRLNLAKNHLTALPPEMAGLSRLTQLQLQGNNLASVPPCLGRLQLLRVLNVGGNYKLKEGGLGAQLAGLGSLRDATLPYRLGEAAAELRQAGKAVQLD